MNRRTLIKRGLLGGGILSVFGSGFLVLRQGQYEVDNADTLATLDVVAFSVLAAAARRVIALDADEAVTLSRQVDTALTFGPASARADFVQVLHLLENGLAGVVFRGSPRLFTELSPDAQTAALEGWRDSRITLLRGAYHGIRRIVLGTYYAQLDHALAIGYPGPVFDKPYAGDIAPRGPLSPPYIKRPVLDGVGLPPPAANPNEVPQ